MSVFAHAEVDDEFVEVVFLGHFEEVFARLLPERQVDGVGVEPELDDFLLLLDLDVAAEYGAEQRRLPTRLYRNITPPPSAG